MTTPTTPDPLKPNAALLAKLGSIAVHVDEYLSDKGHHFDAFALGALMDDEDIRTWLAQMRAMALIPEKRS